MERAGRADPGHHGLAISRSRPCVRLRTCLYTVTATIITLTSSYSRVFDRCTASNWTTISFLVRMCTRPASLEASWFVVARRSHAEVTVCLPGRVLPILLGYCPVCVTCKVPKTQTFGCLVIKRHPTTRALRASTRSDRRYSLHA